MLIGIDVGGTFTDGVLFDGQTVAAACKHPTDNQDLKATLLKVLDELLEQADGVDVSRIVISTTLVTNLLATQCGDKTALLLLPGPGLPLNTYNLFADTYFLKGSTDFRGRQTAPLDKNEIIAAVDDIHKRGITRAAVVGKFSNRNSSHEKEVRDIIKARYPDMTVGMGSQIAGQLNYLRRIVTTYYSVMTESVWNSFVDEFEEALAARGIQAEVNVLKADGGTMPLQFSRTKPCETVFSGPAASTMGAVALAREPQNAVIIDIGGTTSDLSLLIEGKPLYASKGAKIEGRYTHINAFAVHSLPLGGDSPIEYRDGKVIVASRRRNHAACFGGEEPTVTDAFNHQYSLNIGEAGRSTQTLTELAKGTGQDIDQLCREIEAIVLDRLQDAITAMFREWEDEPAYRVWEVVHGRKFNIQEIVGIGAASAAIIPALSARMRVAYSLPPFAAVANALGACVARPTLALKVHIDTQNGYVVADQDGVTADIPSGKTFQIGDARELAQRYLTELARKRGMGQYSDEAEFFMEEQFNVIRGWSTAGKIFDIGIQIAPGFIKEYQGVS